MSTSAQKITDVITQLNSALLQKDQLSEQLEQTCARVKALRNVLAGVELGQQHAREVQADQATETDLI